ncbi:MAG: CusA/CzcA family heavy metal efflux RND transporter [Bacteroidaceae bacterium]|nr:CusA/CzcA family heavy metal efflux RND transporter [Bacteroidaceae bacterium]
MLRTIIHFSIHKKMFVVIMTLAILLAGLYASLTLPIDAVPDITNNQVQVVTVSPTLAPQEVEQLITQPIEVSLRNIMNVEEIRSVSRFGLSVVTVVFKESVPVLDARQLVNEQLQNVQADIPDGIGVPEMMPISTGLGEIYQYVLKVSPGYEDKYDAMELRTIQDWIVSRHLAGIPGIVEINSFGGYLKQYEVALDEDALFALDISINQVYDALCRNNENTGGSYIEKNNTAYYIRSEGMIGSLADIEEIVVDTRDGVPIHVRDIGDVQLGYPKRFGALTMDGVGESVGGIAMMLRGANANEVTQELEKRVAEVQQLLPEGVVIEPYLNRSELVKRNISTVIRNLTEGALIVFLVLMFFLGDVRAGLITASVIPLAMLFGFILMRFFGVSANLMSLGAIDFGIVVDGSIVILEGIMAHLYGKHMAGRTYTDEEMDAEVETGACKVVRSASFAVVIILLVFFPILALTGIEGKYFTPMAKTLVFCIIGAFLLSLTYVPMMASLFLKRTVSQKPSLADRLFEVLNRWYEKALRPCLRRMWLTLGVAFSLLAGSLLLFSQLGAEFIPTLDEGDFAMQMTLPVGSSLSESIDVSLAMEKALKEKVPEVKHVVAKIGTAEVPTDPMSVETADVIIVMAPFKEWTTARTREAMVDTMKAVVDAVGRAEYNFSQPIQLRFNELMSGAKADIAIVLYGEDLEELNTKAHEAAQYIRQVSGVGDVIVEQGMGLPQLLIEYDRVAIARFGLNIQDVNTIIRTAYAGETAGVVLEHERRFDLVLRLNRNQVTDVDLDHLFIRTHEGMNIPLSELATTKIVDGPMQINRDATKRRTVVGVNVRGGNTQQVVADIQKQLAKNVTLKPGYYFEYGGSFENLQNAIDTLSIVIPIALALILLLLFFAFRSVVYTLVVFSTVPLSLIGGIVALWLRGLPFSISAGVGFIALFGVAVLNGILMLNHFKDLHLQSSHPMCTDRVITHCAPHLLRPVLLTGLVASFGFLPMAVATSAGAEVQRPLATVVIGGLLIGTVLTLIIIPVFYRLVGAITVRSLRRSHRKAMQYRKARATAGAAVCLALGLLFLGQSATAQTTDAARKVSIDEAVRLAIAHHPRLQVAAADVERNRAAKGEVWDGGATELSFSRGQLNGDFRKDYEIALTQPLGSPVTPFYKNALVKSRVTTAEQYRELVKKEITAEVKRAWTHYQYACELLRLYQEQETLANRLKQTGTLRYEQGDISLLERNIIGSMATELHTRLIEVRQEQQLAAQRFAWSCFAGENLLPADTVLTQFTLHDASGLTPSQTYLDYFAGQVDEKQKSYQVEKSKYFPELSVGWNNQRIEPLKGLNSFMVGMSMPLVFAPQRSRSRQAKYEWQMAEQTAELNRAELTSKVMELRSQLLQQQERLAYYTSAALPEADALQQSALLQFKEGDTDMVQLVQSLQSALNIHEGYMQTLYNYNVAVIENELYAEP